MKYVWYFVLSVTLLLLLYIAYKRYKKESIWLPSFLGSSAGYYSDSSILGAAPPITGDAGNGTTGTTGAAGNGTTGTTGAAGNGTTQNTGFEIDPADAQRIYNNCRATGRTDSACQMVWHPTGPQLQYHNCLTQNPSNHAACDANFNWLE